MARVISSPVRLRAAGTEEKSIFEYVGRMSGEDRLSIAHMQSPAGWSEPGQTPDFQEITLILSGSLQVETAEGLMTVSSGQAVVAEPGDWARYSTPDEPAEYVAICTPAFSPGNVHRDTEVTAQGDGSGASTP